MNIFALILALGAVQDPPSSSDVAATVNTEIITWVDVEKELKGIDKSTEGYEQLRRNKLREMVENMLFVQEAKKLRIEYTERDIEEKMKQTADRLGGEGKFLDYLRINRMTREQYRVKLKEDMLVGAVLSAKRYDWRMPDSKVPGTKVALHDNPTPAEIREYYVANKDKFEAVEWVTVFRMKLNYSTPEERVKKEGALRSTRRHLADGADFLALAQIYSDDVDPKRPEGALVFEKMTRDNHPFGAEVGRQVFDVLERGGTTAAIDDGKSLCLYFLADKEKVPAKSMGEAWSIISENIVNERWMKNRERLRNELLKPPSFVQPRDLFAAAKP